MEYCIVNDEGVVEDGFYSLAEAETAIVNYADSSLLIDERHLYDKDGCWIES